MKLAIASGKGGTGKTTLAVALSLVADSDVCYLDCDVEEPNGMLFLNPEIDVIENITLPIPEVNRALCTGCGDCSDICQFNAIVTVGDYAMVFPELCISCGGCTRVCLDNAIEEIIHPIGTLTVGHAGKVDVIQGKSNIGVAMSTPIIRAVKEYKCHSGLSVLDCPPGTACPMIETVRDADFVLLVTEPTPFGLHDLHIAVETVRILHIPFAVVINRYQHAENCVSRFCQEEGIDVILHIPEKREMAQAYSRGETLLSVFPDLTVELKNTLQMIESRLLKR